MSTRVHSSVSGSLALCAGALKLDGLDLVPDPTKAYFEFSVAHAFPKFTAYKMGMHPAVIANSFATMRHQMFNLGHLVRFYDAENIARDRIIGCVVGVEFPKAPMGGWKLPGKNEEPPFIRAAASVYKMAEGVDRILGSYQANRKSWTVSMEVFYYREEGGFAVKGAPVDNVRAIHTDDWKAHGWHYVGWADAPKELRACYNDKKTLVDKAWSGREVIYLQGGLDGQVHFQGVGAVQRGAEPGAKIATMLAADPALKQRVEGARKIIADFQKELLTPLAEAACR